MSGTGSASWLDPLRQAYLAPWTVAEGWRADGGKVVGVLGASVPRELVIAAGMLPVRLSPLRLGPQAESLTEAPPELIRELEPGPALVLAALLGGRLSWLDGLVIGRDGDSWTKLFYTLREFAALGEGTAFPLIAFVDLLRLPSRTSARYNRVRAGELRDLLAGWAGLAPGSGAIDSAAVDAAATAAALRRVAELQSQGAVRGSEALIAAGGAQVLPGELARRALDAAPSESEPGAAGSGRVFVTGSGLDQPWIYELLEQLSLAVVGDDHEWGDDGRRPPRQGSDALDWIVDRYHLSTRGAARAGLHDRVSQTVAATVALRADAVLQIAFEHDEAPGWELPLLRSQLSSEVALETVRLPYGVRDEDLIRDAGRRLLEHLREHSQAERRLHA